MSDSKDDPETFMFGCERCGAWPMAYEAMDISAGWVTHRFACARCKAHSVKARERPDRRRVIPVSAA
jgi:hypothetical protein